MATNKKDIEKDIINLSEDLTTINTKIADSIAQENFKAPDAATFVADTAARIASPNPVIQDNAKQAAGNFAAQLLLLCLYQEIEKPHSIDEYQLIANKFDAGFIPAGNGKEWVVNLVTGSEKWVVTAFNPTTITSPALYGKYMSMYELNEAGEKVLTPQAYQFKKPITIQENEWFPYFTSGELRSFIENCINITTESYMYYKFNKMATLLTTMPISKKITGTATNLFDALALEILPNVYNMHMLNQSYSIDNVKYPKVQTLSFTDMMMFVPLNVKTGLMHGIQSQLFNAHLMDIASGIPADNVIVLGDKIIYPEDDANKVVMVQDGTPYLPNNTIRVFDKNAIKHLQQINQAGSQSYNNNLTIQITLHVWGLVDYLPWKKAFEYTNNNIQVLPGNEVTPAVNSVEPMIANFTAKTPKTAK